MEAAAEEKALDWSQLPEVLLIRIVGELETPKDVVALERTCSSFRRILTTSPTIKKEWRRLWIDRWGDMIFLRSLLEGISILEPVATGREGGEAEKDWKQLYSVRYVQNKNKNAKKKQNATARKHLQTGLERLSAYEERHLARDLVSACESFLNTLNINPNLAEVYLHLGYACSLRRCFETANTFWGLAELLATSIGNLEVLSQVEELKKDVSETRRVNVPGLIVKGEFTRQVEDKLQDLFDQFDEDNDGKWTRNDFFNFVSATSTAKLLNENQQKEKEKEKEKENQENEKGKESFESEKTSQVVETPLPPPPDEGFMNWLFGGPSGGGGEFETDGKGRLTSFGFLSFYLAQTIDDPQETLSDLTAHGFSQTTTTTAGDDS